MTSAPARPRGVDLPAESALRPLYAGADFANANAVALPAAAVRPVAEMARLLLERPAPWYVALRTVRDLVVKPFGLATTAELQAAAERSGEAIGVFPVRARSEREVLLGDEDAHLDVRLSVLTRPRDDGQVDLVVTAVVRCRDGVGRAYLAAVRLVHRTAARSQLRRAARALAVPRSQALNKTM